MEYMSTQSECFLSTVRSWIVEREEVLVLIRFSHLAGSKSWEFFRDDSAFEKRLAELPPRTCVIALQENDLQKTSSVDDAFIESIVKQHAAGEWWLVVCRELTIAGLASWYHCTECETTSELEQALLSEAYFGKAVAVGPTPEWHDERNGLVSAVIPLEDGTVECGVY